MIRVLILAALLVLVGCAGTDMEMSGAVCGQPVELTISDRKDRSAFEGIVECPDGGGVRITTAESSTSAVLAQQTELLGQLTGLLSELAASQSPMGLRSAEPAMPVLKPAEWR